MAPIAPSSLPADPTAPLAPKLPTLVVASYKGGVWKTCIAVALAERLAWASRRVLLVTTDPQEDARKRLGVSADDPTVALQPRGQGSVTVVGAHDKHVPSLLYRHGPERLLKCEPFHLAVVDTPPEARGGYFPGVSLLCPIDGNDASRNLLVMLDGTPANTTITLLKIHRSDPKKWANDVRALTKAAGRELDFLTEPLPKTRPIEDAHNQGQSVWALPRRGRTLDFLRGIDALAMAFFQLHFPDQPWPPLPPLAATSIIDGWDDDDA